MNILTPPPPPPIWGIGHEAASDVRGRRAGGNAGRRAGCRADNGDDYKNIASAQFYHGHGRNAE